MRYDMEIKGIISIGEMQYVTCCTQVQDLLIGGVSLYDSLEKLFNQDAQDYYEHDKQSPSYAVRYVILDEAPTHDVSFEHESALTITNMLYASHVNGCYSEWTCGYGGFDYVLGNGFGSYGHSIFDELKNSIGKYIHFKI